MDDRRQRDRRLGGDRRWGNHEHHDLELRLPELECVVRVVRQSVKAHTKRLNQLRGLPRPVTSGQLNAMDRHRLALTQELDVLALAERALSEARATEDRVALMFNGRQAVR